MHSRILAITFLIAVFSTLVVGAVSAFFLERRSSVAPVTQEDILSEDVLTPLDVFTSSSAPVVSAGAVTSTARLHLPPIAYLLRVKSDPKLQPGETSVRVPILMYHHIREMRPSFNRKERLFSVTPASFAAQMESLKRAGYHAITPRQLEQTLKAGATVLPSKPVLITLDDGYRDQYEQALPVLKRLGMSATFFVVSRADTLRGSMNKEMIRAADASGLVTIASHTQHHRFLTRWSPAVRQEELAGAKRDLEELLGHPVLDFAYPYGAWNQTIAKEVEATGYTLGFGVRLGSLHTSSTRYQLRRIRVLDGEDMVPLLERFGASP